MVCRPPLPPRLTCPQETRDAGSSKVAHRAPPWLAGFHFFGYTARWGYLKTHIGDFRCAFLCVGCGRFSQKTLQLRIKLIKLAVYAAFCHKLGVCARFFNSVFGQNQDPVGILDSSQTVSDGKCRSAVRQLY